jgi:hypothetical protein
MSSYVKSTDFASKDALLSGNPAKIIKGTEIDDEYNAIAVAVNTKADLISPTFTGTPLAPTAVAGTNTTQLATTAFVTAADTAAITAERTATATLTNKTLTSPAINTATIVGGSVTGITDLVVADGGTGVSALTAENVLIGDGTNPVKFVAPGTTGNVLTSNGTTWASTAPALPPALSTASGSAPSYSARAWVNFNGTLSGTITPTASGNVTSITKNGTGDYTINFTTAMSDANYAVSGVVALGASSSFISAVVLDGTKSTTQLRIRTVRVTGGSTVTNEDCANVSVVVFR